VERLERAKPKGLAYLEARAKAMTTAMTKATADHSARDNTLKAKADPLRG